MPRAVEWEIVDEAAWEESEVCCWLDVRWGEARTNVGFQLPSQFAGKEERKEELGGGHGLNVKQFFFCFGFVINFCGWGFGKGSLCWKCCAWVMTQGEGKVWGQWVSSFAGLKEERGERRDLIGFCWACDWSREKKERRDLLWVLNL